MDFIKISRVDNVLLSSPYDKIKYTAGRLFLTTSHIIFIELINLKELWFEYSFILEFSRLQLTPKGIPLSIRCKDFRSLLFIFASEHDCQSCYDTLSHFVYPFNIEQLSAFSYCPQSKIDILTVKIGWNTYEAHSEFARMGLPNFYWSISFENSNFDLCDTYPRCLAFPKLAIEKKLLYESSAFRSRGRLPTLTYLYAPCGTALCRSSQPLRFISKRNTQDEELIRCIGDCNSHCEYMYVVDLRPTINAMAQRAAGKGYESLEFYSNVKFIWGNLPNIHVIRESFKGLQGVLQRYDFKENEQLQSLESCEWLSFIRKLLEASLLCAQALVSEQANVLIHCSDGWDRTSQVSALTQIIIDPFYRTIHGFVILIEKDWISFGHPFTKRCAHIRGDFKDYSPIFLQFLDAVWQLTQQYPTLFEFGESLLILFAKEVYRCKYGTFIYESEKQRIELSLPFRTQSLWGYLHTHIEIYRNPVFDHFRSSSGELLRVHIDQSRLKIWIQLYCQFSIFKQINENVTESVSSIELQNEILADYISYLIKETNLKNINTNFYLRSNDCPNITQLERNKKYLSACNRVKAKMFLPVLNLHPLSKSICCDCEEWKFNQASYRSHCLLCGNVFCLKCLFINSSIPYSKGNILLCAKCSKFN